MCIEQIFVHVIDYKIAESSLSHDRHQIRAARGKEEVLRVGRCNVRLEEGPSSSSEMSRIYFYEVVDSGKLREHRHPEEMIEVLFFR